MNEMPKQWPIGWKFRRHGAPAVAFAAAVLLMNSCPSAVTVTCDIGQITYYLIEVYPANITWISITLVSVGPVISKSPVAFN
jgi:hypothetical protein